METSLINMFEDNQQSIKIVGNPVNYKSSRSIDLKYHFVKDIVEKQIIKLIYVNAELQCADFSTKALPTSKHVKFKIVLLCCSTMNQEILTKIYIVFCLLITTDFCIIYVIMFIKNLLILHFTI